MLVRDTKGGQAELEDQVGDSATRPSYRHHFALHPHVNVDLWNEVHRAYYLDGASVRAVAHQNGVSRRVVRQILFPWPT